MSRKWASRIAFCICLAASRYAFSDGVMVDEVSPRALSRGGTNLGFSDNGGMLLDNPAAMVNVDGSKMVDIGVDTLLVSGWYSDPQTRIDTGSTFTPLPQIALIRNNGDFAYGFGIFTPAGFAERFHLIDPANQPSVYESFGALVKFLPGVAYRVTDRLSIGGTVGVGVSYAELEGPYFLQGPSLPGTPTVFHTHGLGADFIWSAGMQY